MSSLTEVAKKAGVSISTASVVLNPGKKKKTVSPALAERVRDAAHELGYVTNYLAQAMKRGRTNVIGVALHTGRTYEHVGGRLDSTYYASMIAGIERAIAERGYTMMILGSTPEALATERAVEAIQQRQIDGVICPQALLQKTPSATSGLPAVEIECEPNGVYPVVNWNAMAAVRVVVEHLVELGHTDLLWLGPEPKNADGGPDPREAKFMQEIWDRGLNGQSCRYATIGRVSDRYGDEAIATVACEALRRDIASKKLDLFSAVVCFNDSAAGGAYRALAEAGKAIPCEVSVVGFDDFATARTMIPKLTTVSHMFDAIGDRAVDLLVQSIEHPEERRELCGTHLLIEPELVVRDSTAPA